MNAAGVASLIVVIALAAVAFGPDLWRLGSGRWRTWRIQRQAKQAELQRLEDPGRALRAERRAQRALLDALGPTGFEAYKALGFLHVFSADGSRGYLLYPKAAIVSFDPASGEPLDEYEWPVENRGGQLSDAADLLDRWRKLTADEGSLISPSNMHLLGRSVDPVRVRRDLIRLSEWTSRRPTEIDAADSLRHPYHPDRGPSNQ